MQKICWWNKSYFASNTRNSLQEFADHVKVYCYMAHLEQERHFLPEPVLHKLRGHFLPSHLAIWWAKMWGRVRNLLKSCSTKQGQWSPQSSLLMIWNHFLAKVNKRINTLKPSCLIKYEVHIDSKMWLFLQVQMFLGDSIIVFGAYSKEEYTFLCLNAKPGSYFAILGWIL